MDSILLRSANNADLKAVHALAKESGFGLTTLPKSRTLLAQRLEHATASFQAIQNKPGSEYYLFVLEDTNTQQLIGTAAIEAQTGTEAPFYSYKISKRIKTLATRASENQHEDKLLNLVNDHQGHTELCTLYLTPAYRKTQCGSLLSRARFLFMAQYRARFANTVIAEMRGVTHADGHSPFWDALGYHFFHLSFLEADQLTLSSDKQFIADFMPEYPIYIKLLPAAAQAVIGKPHPATVPAMKRLLQEGFYYNHYVDIFDAGPVLEAPLTQIKTFKNTQAFTLKATSNRLHSKAQACLISTNINTHFYATHAKALLDTTDHTCTLSPKTAALLKLSPDDTLLIAPF